MEKGMMIRVFFLTWIAAWLLCGCRQTGELTSEDYARADRYMEQSVEQEYGPVKREDGKKFCIGYVDIDPYPPSGEMLYYLVRQLETEGWISLPEELPFDPQDTDARELVRYLAGRDIGEYLEFSDDACYYLAVDGEEHCRESLERHQQVGDLDLILCMGTWPGQFVQEMGITEIPVMVYFCVDPVGAGLSKGNEYSGQENLWCHVNYTVYNMQLKFYHDNFQFENIGMVYYDESVAAMRAYREVAAEQGFQITEAKIEMLSEADEESAKAYYSGLKKVFLHMAEEEKIDAFMLGTDIIKDRDRITELLSVFYRNKIPVFVQNGEYFVQKGALILVTASDAKDQAPFAAEAFSAILNGIKPGDIPQEYLSPPYVCLNLDAADQVGYEISEDLLLSAGKIYMENREEEK